VKRVSAFALALLAPLAVSGCCLPGGAPDGPSYRVTAEFADALDLVPQAAVKVNDVTVGSVEGLSLSGWTARVRLRLDDHVKLPANATATIRQTSLLGEKFVALSNPADQAPTGRLTDGAHIPLNRTGRTVEVEEVLAALGMLLSGGGLGQLKTINEELATAMGGREPAVTDALGRLAAFLAGLDAQKADIQRAIDALDRFSAHLSEQRGQVAAGLAGIDPGLAVLARQREQLTAALTALSELSTVGTHVVDASREATLSSLGSLHPLLDQLVRAGDDLPKALNFMLTYPFPPNVTGAVVGDHVRLHVTVNLDGATILANLLTAPAPPAAAAGAVAPAVKPGVPAAAGIPAPDPVQSPGPAGGGGVVPGCGLLGILTGCP
jgi:phospholipid/cholesterol/gamma-HCH transport system substrate-binding protein